MSIGKLLTLLLLLPIFASGQLIDNKIVSKDDSELNVLRSFGKKYSFNQLPNDSIERKKTFFSFISRLHSNGYLSASIDSFYQVDSANVVTILHLGKQYKWAYLHKGNLEEAAISEAGYREKLFYNKPFNYKQVSRLEKNVVEYYENNGYPFAFIRLDSIEVNKEHFRASVYAEKGNLIKIDSVIIKGDAKILPVYLYNYLSIKPGSLYNEDLVRQISNRLKELPFLQQSRSYEISFSEKNARLYLYLEPKKSSQFDFVAGILPDNTGGGKIQLSGEAHLKLQNSYGRGEVFEANWKSPIPKTQDLKVRLIYPFLFSTPFGLDLNFNLYKKDTTYLDVYRNAGIQYIIKGGNYFKVFIADKESDLLDAKRYKTDFTPSLPDHADMSVISYGIEMKNERLDYRYNPRKGYSFLISTSAGIKTIKKNTEIPDIKYSQVHLKSNQYDIEYNVDFFRPVSTQTVLNIGAKGAHLIGNEIFKNELFRIGGLKTLRGFDEESILAHSYVIGKVEYRYLMEQNSYVFVFYNTAYYESVIGGKYISDQPYGFGGGITFETKLGIFSFTYALGKQFNNPLYLRSGKIHFGIVSYF